ncbi:DUF2723 domain-containing protein [Myxococcota bacterium]|nr:DUF2723 domain-containing protein [Myxococcota bacterium]
MNPTAARRTALGLPVESPGLAFGVTLAMLALFVATGSRDLSHYDSAELSLVAAQGGLGHPVGQPLHTALGYLVALMGGGAWAFNLLSAVPAALCAVPALSLADHWAGPGAPGRGLRALVVVAGLSHVVFWEPATRVEVYALATLPALWTLARWAALDARPEAPPARALLVAGVALGLSASANPYVAIGAAVAGAPAFFLGTRRTRSLLRALGLTTAGGLLGLVPYAYVFWAAERTGVFVWGGDDLWRYFRGVDYTRNRLALAEPLSVKWGRFVEWSLAMALWLPWLLGLLGALRRAPRLPGLLAWVFMTLLLLSNTQYLPEIPDYFGYLMLPFALSAAGAAAWISTRTLVVGRALLTVLFGLPTFLAGPGPLARTRSTDAVARALSTRVLETAPEGAVVVVASDHFVFPLHYLQSVEGLRPDVVVLAWGLSSSSWYWRHLYERHPTLLPIDLPGPPDERLRRFLAAQGDRPVVLESGELVGAARLRVCAGPLLLQTAPCPSDEASANAFLAGWVDAVGTGSPASDGVLAHVAFERGEALWTLDRPALAVRAYLAGVPAERRALPEAVEARLEGGAFTAPPLRHPPPVWQRPYPLGRPEWNLFRAAELLHRAGEGEAAQLLLRHAAALGLAEAEG